MTSSRFLLITLTSAVFVIITISLQEGRWRNEISSLIIEMFLVCLWYTLNYIVIMLQNLLSEKFKNIEILIEMIRKALYCRYTCINVVFLLKHRRSSVGNVHRMNSKANSVMIHLI